MAPSAAANRAIGGAEHSHSWIAEGTVLTSVAITTTVVDSIG
ncbi:hypothetical protein V1227_04715 [Lentzea sp. DG1S-22]|nr:hypothetical protein [Lentzea sp. DG1S-22]WVH82062.1 hypothetical protein V1227_04715 [Lentzea sp. DG1S-22]